jgi:hypothetical protein
MRVILSATVFLFANAAASAQTYISLGVSDALDLMQDTSFINGGTNYNTISGPFTFGFLEGSNLVLKNPGSANALTQSQPPFYTTDCFYAQAGNTATGTPYNSEIFWNFGASVGNVNGYNVPPTSVTLLSIDLIPAIELKVPKGTYSITSTATPVGGTSTPATFELQTGALGQWGSVFAVGLSKPEGNTKTLTFTHDTRLRWSLVRTGAAQAEASVTIHVLNTSN